MTQTDSPILDFYPLNFKLDAEGKRQDWEAVVLLKFIDVPRLRSAEGCVLKQALTTEEIARNNPGQLQYFHYDPGQARSSSDLFASPD